MEDVNRPDGSVASGIGWVLVVVGVLAGFLASGAETLEWMIIGFAICNLAVGVGVLLLSLGYLVHAISFLPGREMPTSIDATVPLPAASCEWCGQNVRPPNEPCARVDLEKLRGFIPKIANQRCIAAFDERGLLGERDREASPT